MSLVSGCGNHLGHVQKRTLSLTFRYGDGILVPSTTFIKKNPQQTQRLLRCNGTAKTTASPSSPQRTRPAACSRLCDTSKASLVARPLR